MKEEEFTSLSERSLQIGYTMYSSLKPYTQKIKLTQKTVFTHTHMCAYICIMYMHIYCNNIIKEGNSYKGEGQNMRWVN